MSRACDQKFNFRCDLVYKLSINLETRYQVSFWDALVIQAAQVTGAEILYSENLSDGATVRNSASQESTDAWPVMIERCEPAFGMAVRLIIGQRRHNVE